MLPGIRFSYRFGRTSLYAKRTVRDRSRGSRLPPDDLGKAALRGQALAWLQAEVDRWTKFLESSKPEQRQVVVQTRGSRVAFRLAGRNNGHLCCLASTTAINVPRTVPPSVAGLEGPPSRAKGDSPGYAFVPKGQPYQSPGRSQGEPCEPWRSPGLRGHCVEVVFNAVDDQRGRVDVVAQDRRHVRKELVAKVHVTQPGSSVLRGEYQVDVDLRYRLGQRRFALFRAATLWLSVC